MGVWARSRRRLASYLLVLSVAFLLYLGPAKKLTSNDSYQYTTSNDSYKYIPHHRVVHIDLKGAPPTIEYLATIFPLIQEAGATALLIEWEDMFPYTGILKNASSKTAYTLQEVYNILTLAAVHHLLVIPLVQTFGHLEHVLKLPEFLHLREEQPYPQSLCPSYKASFNLVAEMIDQVMAVHQGAPFLHIGCDEVFQLASCHRCAAQMRKMALQPTASSPKHLFLRHVSKVADYVRTKHGARPIIWDDMLRDMDKRDLLEVNLGEMVDIMVWVYVEDIDNFIDTSTWYTYSHVFSSVWVASAFKGAFGERLFTPNMVRHHENHLIWLEVMRREAGPMASGKPIHFQGLVLTGWSRYDHFAVLCELLPVALPSLILNLVTVSNPRPSAVIAELVGELLQCPEDLALLSDDQLRQDPFQFELAGCSFPGAVAFEQVGLLHFYRGDVEAIERTMRVTQGWLSQYNIRHNFSSPYRLKEDFSYLVESLADYGINTGNALAVVLPPDAVAEWLEQNVLPLQEKLSRLMKDVASLTGRKTWPRRPVQSAYGYLVLKRLGRV